MIAESTSIPERKKRRRERKRGKSEKVRSRDEGR
jgi:hypothetical protein